MLRVDLIAAVKISADPDRRIHAEISQILDDLSDDAHQQRHRHDRGGGTELLADPFILQHAVALHAADIEHDIADILEQLAAGMP